MERIICYVLPLFVLLVVYLAFKLFKNRSLYLAAAAENERLQAEIDAQQKEIFLWSRKGEEFVPASDEDVARFKLPYPIIHRELMELRPKFMVRRLYGNWIFALSGASVFVKAIDNDEKDGYSENWVHNHEMSVEEYQKQLKIKE